MTKSYSGRVALATVADRAAFLPALVGAIGSTAAERVRKEALPLVGDLFVSRYKE